MLKIHDCLRRAARVHQGRESEPTAIVIDSQSVKTTEARANAALMVANW
jgi:hypothetical protein